MNDPAIDLAMVLAVISSFKDRAIDEKTIAFGEVGLSGEVRSVSMASQRVQEAKKMGFERVIMPQVSIKSVSDTDGIELIGVRNLREAMNCI